MKSEQILAFLLFLAWADCGPLTSYFLSDEFIEEINDEQGSWVAGRNFGKDIPSRSIENLIGLQEPKERKFRTKYSDDILNGSIPEEFDARSNWPQCPTIGQIGDQGSCTSSWAIATASAISDRTCIAYNGTVAPVISAFDLVTCCDACSFGFTYGCMGGNMAAAWDYWTWSGVVTGGPFESHQGCKPYAFPPCDHVDNGTYGPCSPNGTRAPPCKTQCEAGYNKTYSEDLYVGDDVYYMAQESPEQIQFEILVGGPVTAAMNVFADFLHYKSGVYYHVKGPVLGKIAVKILGWGYDDDPYWLVANSWNTEWGDKGYFKIYRGISDCDIEDTVLAGQIIRHF